MLPPRETVKEKTTVLKEGVFHAFLEAKKRLTLEGNIVISVGRFGHSGDDEVWTEGAKEIDSWEDQAAIDAHHASPMMATIASLREKYDLHMTVERYVRVEYNDADRRYIRK